MHAQQATSTRLELGNKRKWAGDPPTRSIAPATGILNRYAIPTGRRPTCPQGHGLALISARTGTCDVCNAAIAGGQKVAACGPCNYYACSVCSMQVVLDAARAGAGEPVASRQVQQYRPQAIVHSRPNLPPPIQPRAMLQSERQSSSMLVLGLDILLS